MLSVLHKTLFIHYETPNVYYAAGIILEDEAIVRRQNGIVSADIFLYDFTDCDYLSHPIFDTEGGEKYYVLNKESELCRLNIPEFKEMIGTSEYPTIESFKLSAYGNCLDLPG